MEERKELKELNARADALRSKLLKLSAFSPDFGEVVRELHAIEAKIAIKTYRKPYGCHSGGVDTAKFVEGFRI